jgi:hypothetical protein
MSHKTGRASAHSGEGPSPPRGGEISESGKWISKTALRVSSWGPRAFAPGAADIRIIGYRIIGKCCLLFSEAPTTVKVEVPAWRAK